MLHKYQLTKIWDITRDQYNNDEDDQRKINEVIVDFTIDSNAAARRPLIHQIKQTIQILSTMLTNPSLPKYERSLIKDIIETNEKLIGEESEVSHA